MRPRIAVVNSSSFGRVFPGHWEELASLGAVKRFSLPASISGPALARALKGHTHLIASVHPTFSREFFEAMKPGGLKLLARHGIGCNNVDLAAATAHGVLVTRVAGPVEREAMAEHTLALALSVLRKLPQAQAAVRAGGWADRHLFVGKELKGRTFGIAGLGNVGARVAEIAARGFGARVLACDPGLASIEIKRRGAEPVSFRRLLGDSDVLSLHCPLTPATRHLLGRESFKFLRPGAILVNTARGELVDNAALQAALKSGRLAGAGLDVLEGEPLSGGEHPLLKFPQVLLVPHLGAYTLESLEAMGKKCVQDLRDLLRGRRPSEALNPEVLTKIREA